MKRTLLLGTVWAASAASAVGLGFLAVSLVDASASPGTVPQAVTSPTTASDDAASPTTPTAQPAFATKATQAGIVSSDCGSGSLEVSGAPAAGWWVDDSSKAGEVEFENGRQKLEVTVTCVDGSPRFAVEGPRADHSGGGDDQPSPAPAATDAPDDSDGRSDGGHGSDDPPGDDSAGRTESGNGSDDSKADDSKPDDSKSDDSKSDDSGSDDSGKGSDDSRSDDSGGHGGDDSGSDD